MEKAQAETNRCECKGSTEPYYLKSSAYFLCLDCGTQYPCTPEDVTVPLCPEHEEPMILASCPECDLEEE